MIRTATIFRHILDNGPATIADVLRERDVEMNFIDVFSESIDHFDPLSTDLLVVLGGACGVYQEADYPFLAHERRILERRLKADRPTLGICLGAQLMASALGAKVYKAPQGPEIGWYPLEVNEAGQDSAIRYLDETYTQVMQWHGDTFDLPEGATLLASSEKFENQAFQYGHNGLGLQCHIEVTEKIVQAWSVGAAYDVYEGSLDLKKLLADTDHWAAIMQQQSEIFLHDWLDRVG
ncbi:MAG: glutamine amidotransferase-related protein [Micavibrio sp.]